MSNYQKNLPTREETQRTIKLFHTASEKQSALLKAMGVNTDLFTRVCCNALVRNPDLAQCNRESLYTSVFKACEMGLMPDGKHGAIVPMNIKGVKTAQFWPMVDGLLYLVRKNLPGIAIQAHNVFADDEFSDQRGSRPLLVHNPSYNPGVVKSVDTLIASYATAHMRDNDTPEVHVMTKAEMDVYKKNFGPWVSHPLEMYRVRPMSRLLKRLPIASSLSAQLEMSEDEVTPPYEDPNPIDITPTVDEAPAPQPGPKHDSPTPMPQQAQQDDLASYAPAQPAPEPAEDDLF